MARHSDIEDLAALLEAFEEDTCGAAVSNHDLVVKVVGDEVLFVTDQPADAAEIALRLTSPDRDRKGLPALRAGMAAGRVLTRFGDVYRPVVKPGRAADVAGQAGYALVDAEVAAARCAGRRIPAAAPAARGRARVPPPAVPGVAPTGVAAQALPGPTHGAVIGTKSTALGGYVGSV